MGLGRGHRAAGEDHVQRTTLADEPRQADRAQVDEWDAKTAVEDAERRILRRHPKVAPERQLEPARDRIALDGRDHRLVEHQARRPHGARSVLIKVERRTGCERLEVEARAERPARAREDRDAERSIVAEAREALEELGSGLWVDGVAHP